MRVSILRFILTIAFTTALIGGFPLQLDGRFWQDNSIEIRELQDKAEAIGKRNIDSVLLLLKQAESIASTDQEESVLAQNYWVKAKTYYGLKEYQKAIDFGKSGLGHGRRSNAQHVLSKINNLLGVIAKRQGNLDLAAGYYRSSLVSRRALDDSVGMSKTLQNLGNLFRDQGLTDSAFAYYELSIDLKMQIDDPVSLAKTIVNLGNYYYEIGDFLEAVKRYESATNLYLENDYQEGVARALNNMGSAYLLLGYYQLSLNSFIKSVEMYETLGLQQEQGNTLLNIASLYRKISNLKESRDYYNQSLRIYQALDNDIGLANAYLGISIVNLLDEKPLKAIETLDKSRDIYQANGREKDLASVEHAYGRAYARLREYPKAKMHFKESITTKRRLADLDDLGGVYNSLAVTNYETKEYVEAQSNYLLSLAFAQEYKLPALVRASLLGLSETNQALGNSKRAYDYRLQYESVKDSLDNVEKARQLAEIREIYESEQKDKQITQLELQNEVVNAKSQANAALAAKERTDKLIFIITALALLVLAIFLYLHFRQRLLLSRLKVKEEKETHDQAITHLLGQQQTKSLEAMIKGQEEERIRIAKELHDHFGSLMAAVKVNLSTVAANNGVAPESERQMKNLSTLVDQACEDIRGLSHSMHVGVSESFGLVPALKDLTASINHSGEIKVEFLSSQCVDALDAAIEITAYRLVQELVSNVLKHAEAKELTIQLTCLENILNIIVEDNGVGFDLEYQKKRKNGMGLLNMKHRVDALHGEFEVDSLPGKGTTVIIDLPVDMEQTALAYD